MRACLHARPRARTHHTPARALACTHTPDEDFGHNERRCDTRTNRCASCSKAVTGRVVHVADSYFHKECFNCAKCSAALGAKFELCEGRLLCHQCFRPSQPVAPPLPAPSEGKPVAVPGLPNGWCAKMDSSSGRVFYVHSVAGTTQWTHPGNIRSSSFVPGDGTRNRAAH